MLNFLTRWINLLEDKLFLLLNHNKYYSDYRKIADKRIFPAIDITKSGTRKEDLLFKKEDLQKMNVLRRLIAPMGNMEAIEFLIGKLRETKNNAEFFDSMNKSA